MTVPAVHEIDIQPVELFQVPEVLRCVLHTIMFNRALGLVIPKTVDSELFDSVSFVKCGDPSIERRIDEKIEQLCSLVEKSPSFSSAASASTHNASSSHIAASTSCELNLTKAQLSLCFFERRQVKRSTSTSGVSSWFGVGSGSGKLNPATSAPASQTDSNLNTQKGPCWEQWLLNLSVLPPRQLKQHSLHGQQQHQQPETQHQHGSSLESAFESAERVRRSARLEADLREVLLTVLLLANQNRANIPPVLSTDIVPFPYDITVPSLSESTFGMDLLKRMLQATPPPLLT